MFPNMAQKSPFKEYSLAYMAQPYKLSNPTAYMAQQYELSYPTFDYHLVTIYLPSKIYSIKQIWGVRIP